MRIWLISDTHNKHGFLQVPSGVDMMICAGDVGLTKNPAINANEVLNFIEWIKSVDIPHKVWIGGNHDTSLAAGLVIPATNDGYHYLNHEMKEVSGVKIFGSPYTPEFGVGWAFNVKRSKMKNYWDEIPLDADIVVTHGPPYGIADFAEDHRNYEGTMSGKRVGCVALRKRLELVAPRLHVFGHIHEDGGKTVQLDNPYGTKFVNAAVLTLEYKPIHNGIIFELGDY